MEEIKIGETTFLVQTQLNLTVNNLPESAVRAQQPEEFDLKGAARYLGPSFTPRWLRENCKRLGIPHVRIKRKFRFMRAELDRFLARYRIQGKKGVYTG
jgi:nitrogenase molybdenum-iron protein alpha/beta subunit